MLPAIPEPPRSKKFGMFVLPSWPQREQCHEGRLYHDRELKDMLAAERPYGEWVRNITELTTDPAAAE